MDNLGVYTILLLALAAFVGWIVSEFSTHRGLRIALGVVTLALTLFIAFGFGVVAQRFTLRASYGYASRQLIETMIARIESGRTDSLVLAMRTLRDELDRLPRTKVGYDAVVERACGDE
jgi:hypothetical protein